MKKGQQPKVAKLELLARVFFRGGLAERLNAADCKSVNGARTTVQGFESLTRLQTITSPARSANCEQGLNLGLAPKAGLLGPLSFWTRSPEESKVQNVQVRSRYPRPHSRRTH